jgi:hypothetical protein
MFVCSNLPYSPLFLRRSPPNLLLQLINKVPQKALLATRNIYLRPPHIRRVLAVAKLMDPFVDPSDSAVEGWARDELDGRCQLLSEGGGCLGGRREWVGLPFG